MLVRACEEHHGSSGVQYALKPRDDVRGDERVEVSYVRALRATSAGGSNEETLAGLTSVGVKYGRGHIEWFVGALGRIVPSDGEHNAFGCWSREREGLWATNSQAERSAGEHPGHRGRTTRSPF